MVWGDKINRSGMVQHQLFRIAACLMLVAMVATQASAIVYTGPFVGDTVVFSGVTETSGTDPVPLYGPPVTPPPAINFLVFEPNASFVAFAPNAVGSGDTTDGRLQFLLTAKPGNFLGLITVNEGGDFTISGSGTVNVGGSIRIKDPVTTLNIGSAVGFSKTGVPSSGTSDGLWSATATIDLTNLNRTEVLVVIDNTLSASVNSTDGSAFIAKKDFSVAVTTFVPEPASLALLGIGSLVILTGRGRKA